MDRIGVEELADLARRARDGDVAARNRIVEANMGWAVALCRVSRSGRHIPPDDRLQVAFMAMMGAVASFDPARGAFTTWAKRSVLWALKNQSVADRAIHIPAGYVDGSRKESPYAEDASRAMAVLSFDDVVYDGVEHSDPGDAIDRREALSALREAIDSLPSPMSDLMRLHAEGCAVEVAGRSLGMSRSRTWVVHSRAMDLIRVRMGVDPVDLDVSELLGGRSGTTPDRRPRRLLEVDGETLTLSDWSRRAGISRNAITKRLKRGMSPREAIFSPANPSMVRKSAG